MRIRSICGYVWSVSLEVVRNNGKSLNVFLKGCHSCCSKDPMIYTMFVIMIMLRDNMLKGNKCENKTWVYSSMSNELVTNFITKDHCKSQRIPKYTNGSCKFEIFHMSVAILF